MVGDWVNWGTGRLPRQKQLKVNSHSVLGIVHILLHLLLQFHVVGATVYHHFTAEVTDCKTKLHLNSGNLTWECKLLSHPTFQKGRALRAEFGQGDGKTNIQGRLGPSRGVLPRQQHRGPILKLVTETMIGKDCGPRRMIATWRTLLNV